LLLNLSWMYKNQSKQKPRLWLFEQSCGKKRRNEKGTAVPFLD